MLKIVNNTVPEALRSLGYGEAEVSRIVEYVDEHETIEGAPGLRPEHVPVFDCAFRAPSGTRSIGWQGHIKMMAAVQPFLSGSISKTVNLPGDATVEDIERCTIEAWRQGLKCIAIYRDGCKRSQPLATGRQAAETKAAPQPVRKKLPDERPSLTHKFSIAGHEGYLTVGMYEDGTPGEIFVRMAKEGSTISGLMDSFATAISIALQHGVPLKLLVDKFSHTRFEPSGFTGNPDIGHAKSIMDYIFRWLGLRFLGTSPRAESAPPIDVLVEKVARGANGSAAAAGANGRGLVAPRADVRPHVLESDAPTCHECGTIMVRSGACHKCPNCGATSGCS
jgi:ribonucleoside-diphosphate reductase alpha chain